MSEPSEELPLRRIETDTVIESRWSEADGFPMPLTGLIDLTNTLLPGQKETETNLLTHDSDSIK